MRFTLMALLLGSVALVPQVASAQSSLAPRVDKLEGEMRAVQRKVFPGGSGQTFEPQIRSEEDVNRASPGTPASSPVADLEARVNALESQLSSLTGQIETTQHRTQQLDDAFNAYKRSTDARLKALEDTTTSTGGGGGGGSGNGASSDPAPVGDTAPGRSTRPVTPSGSVTRPTTPREPTKTPTRSSAAADIEKPSTGEAAEDAYVYGYRLWQAKAYPEAEAQFKLVVANYPRHKRASYAQNMLGRTYLDEGKPSLASIAFYDNYKKMPDGDRAPDSLYNLAGALMKLNKPADACKVYGELSDVYAGKITDGMRADIARGRTEAKCTK